MALPAIWSLTALCGIFCWLSYRQTFRFTLVPAMSQRSQPRPGRRPAATTLDYARFRTFRPS